MSEKVVTGPYDRKIDAIDRIATALGAEITENGDRLRDALDAIADWLEAHTLETGAELPVVTAANNGAVLKVVNGAWAIGSDAAGDTLPVVTASDAGAVLTVTEQGVWAAVAPEAEPAG